MKVRCAPCCRPAAASGWRCWDWAPTATPPRSSARRTSSNAATTSPLPSNVRTGCRASASRPNSWRMSPSRCSSSRAAGKHDAIAAFLAQDPNLVALRAVASCPRVELWFERAAELAPGPIMRYTVMRSMLEGSRSQCSRTIVAGACASPVTVPRSSASRSRAPGSSFDIAAGYRDAAEIITRPGSRFGVMVPFAGRIADARYRFDGGDYDLQPGAAPGKRESRHGFVRDTDFAVTELAADARCARLTLSTSTGRVPGYPFAIDVSVSFALDGQRTRARSANAQHQRRAGALLLRVASVLPCQRWLRR